MIVEVITDSAIPEVIDLSVPVEVVQNDVESQIVITQPPDIVEVPADDVVSVLESTEGTVTEQVTATEVVVTPSDSVVTDRLGEIMILESCMQGPPGPPGTAGGTYPAKRMSYVGGELTEVRLYSDSLATQLAERRYIGRTGGNVTSIVYYDADDNVLKVRQFSYNPDGTLYSVTDT